MACSNNCSGCGSRGGCFGALNCIAGPLTHCGNCAANGNYYANYPYYTGPCGPCHYRDTCEGRKCIHPWNGWNPWGGHSGCGGCSGWNGWNHGWNHGCGCARVSERASCLCSTSAQFIAETPQMVAAGCMVRMNPLLCNSDYFVCGDEGIFIHRPGTYMAIYTAHIPAMQSVSTRMFLTLNDNIIDGSHQDVATVADGNVSGSTAHVIFHALPGSILRLMTTEELSISSPCDSAGGSPFSLTLMRLG